MSHNSTIRVRQGICPMCGGTKKQPLTKGLCQMHYWNNIRQKSALKAQEKELQQDEDLQTLVDDLDIIFGRYIRLKDADLYGRIECYCCGEKVKWTMADASHFIPRAHMYTRFLEMNVKPCCQGCNRVKDGNLAAFAGHLERDNPGAVEILQEQARIVQHWSREELKGLIAHYTRKLKQAQKNILS